MKKIRFIIYIYFFLIIFSLSGQSQEVLTRDFFRNTVNWTKLQLIIPTREKVPKIITNAGFGVESQPNSASNISEARTRALNLAKEKINLQSVRSLEQIRFDSKYSIYQKIQESTAFREKFNQFILKENLEYSIKIKEDEIHAEALIPFRGKDGLLESLVQEYDTEKFPEFATQNFISSYTGLIVDARHLEAQPALFPKILTDKGLEIYSSRMVNKNMAIDKGVITYHFSLEDAMKDSRIGKKPFLVLALTSLGKNKTDFSLPTNEAQKLLASKETQERLKRCAVIILIDPSTIPSK